MVEISMHGDRVHFEVQGWDKFWALKSCLEFPLSHIRSVRHDPEPARGWWQDFRLPGAEIPGVLTAGTFYQRDGAVCFDVHDPEQTIVLELDHEHYRRLVIEVADPAAAVSTLQKAMGSVSAFTVAGHFEGRDSGVKATYAALLRAARTLGPVSEDPKKTSIHVNRKAAFAGVAKLEKPSEVDAELKRWLRTAYEMAG